MTTAAPFRRRSRARAAAQRTAGGHRPTRAMLSHAGRKPAAIATATSASAAVIVGRAMPSRAPLALAARRLPQRCASSGGSVNGNDGDGEAAAAGWRASGAWDGKVERVDAQFGAFADSYDVHRPSYPRAVFDTIARLAAARAAGGSSVAVDVGAGTGRVALALAERGDVFAKVVATDSDDLMLRAARASAASVAAADAAAGSGTTPAPPWAELVFKQCRAESLPLRAGAADVVTCFQAFHWFDADAALAEFARVLGPHGLFFAGWNDRDIAVPWVEAFEALIERHNPRFDHRAKQSDGWLAVLTRGGHFGPIEGEVGPDGAQGQPWVFRHESPLQDAECLLELCRTFSYVENAMSPSQFERFANDARALVADAHGGRPFAMPYATKLYALAKPTDKGR